MKKTKRKPQSRKKSQKLNWRNILLLIGILFVLLSSLFLNSEIRTFLSRADETEFNTSPTQKNKRLDLLRQLETPPPDEETPNPEHTRPPNQSQPTATPKPVPTSTSGEEVCTLDNRMTTNCRCPDLQGLVCVGEQTQGVNNYYYLVPGNRLDKSDTEGQYLGVKGKYLFRYTQADYARKKQQSGCVEWCIGKPVIYLYPEVPTFINVEVTVPGHIFISDPLYPEGGWQDVLAYPNGNLEYKGKSYRDLYYETALNTDLRKPKNGIIIPSNQLENKLKEYTMKLGLNEFESSEFNEYWVPLLEDLDAPYILFSILERDEKERIDHVEIIPAPDTFIDFIAYFKPVYQLYAPETLVLPAKPQERLGFTAVEWGGTIDTEAIRE